jgi:hypothetical protein
MNCTCTETKQGRTVSLANKTWGPGTVTRDPGYIGLDGRHWLTVLIGTSHFNVPCVEVFDYEPVGG